MRHYGATALLAIALATSAAHSAQAQSQSGGDLGLFASYLDTDDLKEAYGAGAKLKLNVTHLFALDIRGSYLEFDDTEISVIPVEGLVLLQIPLGSAMNAYGGVGVGYYFFDADNADLEDSVGYFPVAGFEVTVGSVKLFGEVRWLALSPDVDAAEDEIEGIVEGDSADADGIGVNIGLAIPL
jgi:hypothetical protein